MSRRRSSQERDLSFIEESGAWLLKTAAASALGKSAYNFIKDAARTL